MNRPSANVLGVLAITTLALAGCGGSSKQAASSSAATSTSTSTATQTGTVLTLKHAPELGSILAAGPKRLTVYVFEGDKGLHSSCSGACAQVWEPLITMGDPVASGGAHASDLGTIRRSDGTEQVTYSGHPLYTYASDVRSNSAYGQALRSFGALWHVLSASGAPRL